MSRLMIRDYRNIGYTSVSNQFIDCYMADANDAQLKVYLYLLRHSKSKQDTSMSALADYFNYTEKDILRALSYWQEKKIIKLDHDDRGQIAGITLFDPSATETRPMSSSDTAAASTPQMVSSAIKPSASVYSKPDYSLEQLSAFKDRETTSQLVFIAESYLGKTLSAGDIRSLLFISDELHFSFDLIDYLLQYCVDRGKKDFRYIEKVAISWAQAHISTPDEAEQSTSRYSKHVYTVMNALGKSSSPTPREVEYITRWYQEYGFTIDIILEACERTVLGTDKRRFEYADKILSSWKAAGVHHKQDISRVDASYSGRKRVASVSRNKFNQFQQNDYDFDALEQELLSN
ncbi:MAG: DnaD domain protein [Lachnospiraceae bacterium]|nr:DnaD domain protein [Lachnospiraceae bacterium]